MNGCDASWGIITPMHMHGKAVFVGVVCTIACSVALFEPFEQPRVQHAHFSPALHNMFSGVDLDHEAPSTSVPSIGFATGASFFRST